MAAKGGLSGADPATAIRQEWETQIAAVEARMQESWLERSFVPLRQSVTDYEVRRLRACNQAIELVLARGVAHAAELTRGVSAFEVWVQSPDGRVGGYIDHVTETPSGTVLRDYKTGYVLEKTSVAGILEAKESYQEQLQLYAALYRATFSQWPAGLEIVPLQGEPIPVPFDPDGCTAQLGQAIDALEALNRQIASNSPASGPEPFATPSPEVCSFCPYRPVCHAYWDTRQKQPRQPWPNDCRGMLLNVHTLGNGKRLLSVDTEAGPAVIRSLDSSPASHPALVNANQGVSLSAYNLRPTSSPSVWEQSPMTVLYRPPS